MKTRKLNIVPDVKNFFASNVPEPTPEMRADRQLDDVLDWAHREAKAAAGSLNEWRMRFEKDPAYALEWASNAFKDAARHNVATAIIAWVEALRKEKDEYTTRTSSQVLRIIVDELRGEVHRKAKYPDRSTSVTSNEMSLCMNSARAEWVEWLELRLGDDL